MLIVCVFIHGEKDRCTLSVCVCVAGKIKRKKPREWLIFFFFYIPRALIAHGLDDEDAHCRQPNE